MCVCIHRYVHVCVPMGTCVWVPENNFSYLSETGHPFPPLQRLYSFFFLKITCIRVWVCVCKFRYPQGPELVIRPLGAGVNIGSCEPLDVSTED